MTFQAVIAILVFFCVQLAVAAILNHKQFFHFILVILWGRQRVCRYWKSCVPVMTHPLLNDPSWRPALRLW